MALVNGGGLMLGGLVDVVLEASAIGRDRRTSSTSRCGYEIMAALNALPAGTGLEFSKLKKLHRAHDRRANLGAHIETLSKAGYVAVDKAFVGKEPQTTLTATAGGRGAFAAAMSLDAAGDHRGVGG